MLAAKTELSTAALKRGYRRSIASEDQCFRHYGNAVMIVRKHYRREPVDREGTAEALEYKTDINNTFL